MAKFAQVEEVPEISRDAKSSKLLTEFMDSGLTNVILEPEEYTNAKGETKMDVSPGTAQSLRKAAKDRGLPVAVATRKDGNGGTIVYLSRTDAAEASAE